MLYDKAKRLKATWFRRLTGVQKGTFARMVEVLTGAEQQKHSKHGGRTPRLSIEDRLLMALMYWRENRTYFHVAQAYGMSDSECWRTIRWIEDTLIRSGVFRLPGKKQLVEEGTAFEVVLIDATETPVERPKKSSAAAIPARKSGTR
jgi:Helix-turn-helix of DDE superfamily endonuclease